MPANLSKTTLAQERFWISFRHGPAASWFRIARSLAHLAAQQSGPPNENFGNKERGVGKTRITGEQAGAVNASLYHASLILQDDGTNTEKDRLYELLTADALTRFSFQSAQDIPKFFLIAWKKNATIHFESVLLRKNVAKRYSKKEQANQNTLWILVRLSDERWWSIWTCSPRISGWAWPLTHKFKQNQELRSLGVPRLHRPCQ